MLTSQHTDVQNALKCIKKTLTKDVEVSTVSFKKDKTDGEGE